MHVAAVQLDIVWEDKAANHATIASMLRQAGLPRGSFVLLPELADTGFSFDLTRIADDRTLPWACALARDLGVWIQAGHARRGPDGRGRNCATIVSPDGEPVGTYEKVHPFSYGREIEHFSGGDRLVVRECGEAAVCPLVCYDLRFPELWRLAAVPGGALRGAELFTIGASWPEARQRHWRSLLIARAIENQAFVVGANRIGRDPNVEYAGGSVVVSPTGEILAEVGAEPAVLRADLDLARLRAWRREFPALRDVRRGLLGGIEVDGPRAAAAPPDARSAVSDAGAP
jgi:predicted amidohydrolase